MPKTMKRLRAMWKRFGDFCEIYLGANKEHQ
jgi:hypothetical protein